ncbi:MAG: hypothetical protein IPM92_02105 [Saprospiraceae bacterium]|nr:hypothetical protein [Saprospiraceae bacterium]
MFKLTISFICFSFFKLCSQDSYFQQDLDYKIKVSLDDQNHKLSGFIEIKYKNNSPHILDKIGFHLWPNAYKHKSTAFAKQKIRMGDLNFHEASANALGSIDSLNFKVNGIPTMFHFQPKHEDICWLILHQALLPQQEITISSPFVVKIPENFSRLGRGPESYQMTQWYPKPAVYDHKGWHVMPYLDYGEFFSDFGSFDVEITLPESYVVAASGSLQTNSEIIFLEEKVRWTQNLIEKMQLPNLCLPMKKSSTRPFDIQQTMYTTLPGSQIKIFWFKNHKLI